MNNKECTNPSDTLTIVNNRSEVKGCGNCVIPQILRVPCMSRQATARIQAAQNYGMEIRPNPNYPVLSAYKTIAVCQGNKAIAISTPE